MQRAELLSQSLLSPQCLTPKIFVMLINQQASISKALCIQTCVWGIVLSSMPYFSRTCWYVLVAIIGRITGAAGTCIASTVGTVGTAGTAVGIPVTGAPRTSCSNRAISASISFKRSLPLFPGMPAPGPGTTGPPAPGRPGAGPTPAIAAAVTVSGTTALALWPPPVPLYTLWLRQGGRPRMTYKRKRRAPIHDVMRQQGWPLE